MDEDRYLLRELRDDDYDAIVVIENAIDPDEPTSVDSLRHSVESARRIYDVRFVVVADRGSGDVVGYGVLFDMPGQSDPSRLWIDGQVLPSRQRKGIGSYIYDTLSADARRRGATALRCTVREDSPEGRAFLARRGFLERRRSWRSSLDVASADTSELPALTRAISAEGIEFTTLPQEGANDPAVLHRVYDLDVLAGMDEPHLGTPTPIPFEEFRRVFWEGPNVLADAWFLAKEGDRYVGLSYAAREAAQPDVLQQYFTGTRPGYRRRKIALTLKLMLIDYAKRNGYARIETNNDSLNVPMWTLNQRLGFRRLRERIHLECEFPRITKHPDPVSG
jgi:mycothiol synthase